MSETPFRDRLNEDDPEYRAEHASHRCTRCDWQIFSHEMYECSYCGDEYCPDHRLPEKHDCVDFNSYEPPSTTNTSVRTTSNVTERSSIRDNISEVSIQELAERTRKKREAIETKQDEIKREQKQRFASPDVNPDGSLSEPEYEEDIQSIGSEGQPVSESTSAFTVAQFVMLIVLLAGLATAVYLFVL